MMYDWLFTPDDADIAASNGYDLGVRGGEAFKTESRAIWHGKRWMKECGRTGTITAIPAIYPEPYHIMLFMFHRPAHMSTAQRTEYSLSLSNTRIWAG